MKKVLIIDNYDSFTYNLLHYLEELDCEVTVLRNDAFEIDEIEGFHKILLSPGPGVPEQAGLLKEVIRTYGQTKSILGICLGQQAIGEVFGGQLINLDAVFHGVSTKIKIIDPNEILFHGLENEIEVGRYHSWVVDYKLPDILIPTSVDETGQIMSLRHSVFDVRGVQFHPESVLTPHGKKILENWINS